MWPALHRQVGVMSPTRYIDPIEHAWRHCNPHVPLPSILMRHAAPSGLAFSVYSSHRPLSAESSAAKPDIQAGLLTVATLPRISTLNEGVEEVATPV